VQNITEAPEISKKIYAHLGGRGAGFQAVDWSESNRAFWEAIKLEERVYFIVLLLLILISSFCIVSTLVMVVIEKTKDIAVLKSLGASDRSVMLIFLAQGFLISVVGVITGTALGALSCVALQKFGFRLDASVFALETVPVHMIPRNFVVVAFSALFISSSAGIYPAFRAARLKPAEVLRFE
jgi:lipoprotein-releasing system permease protein